MKEILLLLGAILVLFAVIILGAPLVVTTFMGI